jgi:DNA-binding response OmpR family regulator
VICAVAETPSRCKLVLIVEDELLVGISFQAAFEDEGFDAHLAASPEEAYAFLAHHTPSAAIVDLNLRAPMDGVDVVRHLAQQGVKVVICSAYDRRKIDPSLVFSAYISKPCDPNALVAAVRSALGP